ncbi:MAG: FtsX-like permease family protein [Chthoniobacterales bacterium]|jgi:putative ABC transport system permease protein
MTRHWPRLLLRQTVRHARHHKLLAAMNVLSVALGVCVFLAIMIANRSADRSFRAGVELVAGKANLEVRGPIDETLLPRISAVPGVEAATPVMQGLVTLRDHPGEYLRVLGVDPFTNPPFETFRMVQPDGAEVDVETWLREREAVAVTREMAAKLALQPGDPLRVAIGGRTAELRAQFILEPDDPAALADIRTASMDIAWAQELLGADGKIDSVQILLTDDADAGAVAEAIRRIVPRDTVVAAPKQRSEQIGKMLSSFQLNLTALSLVSMLVGMFLVYNTVAASVVRARREIGILRAVGASRAEVRALFLGEALIFGLPGIALGLIAAFPLAGFLSGAVSQTISSLYVLVSIEKLSVGSREIAAATAAGLGAVVAAAWVPSSEAAKAEVTGALHMGTVMEHRQTAPGRWLVFGTAALAAAFGASWLALHTGPAVLGFAAAFLVVTGFALLVPAATAVAGKFFLATARVAPHGVALRLAARNLVRAMHRNSPTIAALMAAIAMTVGVSVMIYSFRASVGTWIDRTIQADLFLTLAANERAGFHAELPPALLAWIGARPGTEAVDTFYEKRIPFRGEEIFLGVVSGRMRGDLAFTGGGHRAKAARLREPGYVAVSESFAARHKVKDGDIVEVDAPAGPVSFAVAGVYSDYTRDQGVILIDRKNYSAHWPDPGVHTAGVHLRDGEAVTALADSLREKFGRGAEYAIYDNASLRARVLEIFDQTFAVTYVLRTISVLVAVVGVSLGMATLVTEREREIGVLRAVGASARQVGRTFVAEAAMVGAVASAVGLAAGACLAMVLTWVINLAFFGWTVQLRYPWDLLAWTPVWIVATAALAGLIPAIRASRIQPATALRSE